MNPALRLGLGNALHPMPPAFKPQVPIRSIAAHVDDHFLEPAPLRRRQIRYVEAKSLGLAIPLIHLKQVAPEECRLFAAGPGSNFQKETVDRNFLGRQKLVLERLKKT